MSESNPKKTQAFLPPESMLDEKFILTGGPGGQHVNRTETGVQLRFNPHEWERLETEVCKRLIKLAGSRADGHGVITIESRAHRSQHRNREDARQRLAELIERAHQKPKKRIPTRPSRRAQKKRVEAKRKHSRIKAKRKPPRLDE